MSDVRDRYSLMKIAHKIADTRSVKCHLHHRINAIWVTFIVSFCVYFSVSSFSLLAAQNSITNNNQQKLSQVKQAITEKKEAIEQANRKRQQLFQQLKVDDINIAKTVTSMALTKKQLGQIADKIEQLNRQQKHLEKEKNQQEKLLAAQLRAAYASGNHDYLKLVFNQQKPKNIERALIYYRYLNEARLTKIDQFTETIMTLSDVVAEQHQQATKFQTLQTVQQQQRAILLTRKKTRQQTITALNKQLLNNKQSLEQLEIEEANLSEAIANLIAKNKQTLDLNGLGKLKRKLTWPIKAKINRSFGSQKQGYLTWKGVLMKAPVGRQVNTIHHGKVLFADWLKGYGLVTIIDHGKGYMSLYGHNQALLKSVGDRVETGEPIALVGQSGGQSQSALYFEIRYNGSAVNPKLWCK